MPQYNKAWRLEVSAEMYARVSDTVSGMQRGPTAASPFPRGEPTAKRVINSIKKKATVMKQQAIQLEIQWTEPVATDNTSAAARMPQPSLTDRLELAVAAKDEAMLPDDLFFTQGAFFVAFAFAIMFISAIIGG